MPLTKKFANPREKLTEANPHRVSNIKTLSHELSAGEIYATYAKNKKPEELLKKGRTKIAQSLMVEQGLNQEAAYLAADRILIVAERNTNKQ